MSKLTDKLKDDHKQIAKILSEVRDSGLNQEGLKKLNSAKSGLLAHLKLEDSQLYPQLWKAAETDPNLKSKLNILAKEMEAISKAALDFFEKYEKGGDKMEFARDFGRLFQTLSTRIRREESSLYPEFDQLNFEKKAA